MSIYIKTIKESLQALVEANPFNYTEAQLNELKSSIKHLEEVDQEVIKDIQHFIKLKSDDKKPIEKSLEIRVQELQKEVAKFKDSPDSKKKKKKVDTIRIIDTVLRFVDILRQFLE